ncbi:O-antigen ligase [Hymenobacter daecheongensis DSM 21074]|uniref:O-antigen ligase n=1 Tax=Hymenobacter daecheongensis DSM 21074 TaxID=1121955 RepID=A0A1M6DCS4_9BACT|nr:O-antigen ligase family protein [Hymenobacter daecheongensis]SHI70993.1 O-antigen ligase [Hymenobacter daecheongensis DSM 21074]
MASTLASTVTILRLHFAATLFCAFVIVGLFVANYFRILPSIGIAGLGLTAISYALVYKRVANRQQWPLFGSFIVIYGIHLLSGLNTEAANMGEYYRDVVLQLPFVVLPLAFWVLPALPAQKLENLWRLFIGCVVVSALISTGYYLLHAAAINEIYLHSKIMPTEPDHIRFSLMVTLAVAVGVVLLNWGRNTTAWRVALLMAVIYLALFQHLLAVRSGLVTLYAVGGMYFLWLVLRAKHYRRAAYLTGCLLLLPAVSYLCFPTFRNKFINTQEDLGKVSDTQAANNYSLVARVYSYKAAWAIMKQNPVTGVGKADMQDEMARQFRQHYPEIAESSYLLPHNQFIYDLVAFGLLGTLLFAVCFYYPAFWAWPQFAPLLVAQYTLVTLSFLVEYTLETQIGLTFSLFFLLLSLNGLLPAPDESQQWRPA